jgi:hypothetical protein
VAGWGVLVDAVRIDFMERVERYRAELRRLPEWEAYLKKNSGLPGARANLELVEAVGEEADPERLWRLSASSDEFLALCGTAGLGHLAVSDPVPVMSWLHELAADPRWRVREGVAIALQHIGRHSMPRLLAEMEKWSTDGPYVQRAAAAGLCEPSLLKEPEHVIRVLGILDRMTKSMAATNERKGAGVRVLRQALGCCWSVAAAALPEAGRPLGKVARISRQGRGLGDEEQPEQSASGRWEPGGSKSGGGDQLGAPCPRRRPPKPKRRRRRRPLRPYEVEAIATLG